MAEALGSKQISREDILPQRTPTQRGTLPEEPKVNAKDVDNHMARKVNTDSYAFNHFPGFPYFVRNIAPFVPCQSYVRSLFPAGHGYPMYDPMTISKVPEDYHTVSGISIGDVGVLSEDGEFVFAFNIFLSSDHPYNKGNTPNSFSPLEPLEESEIRTFTEYFPRGAVITSKGVKVTRGSESPLNISFRSSERLGGILVLPEGATRQDASTERIHEYVARNAHEWAFFFTQSRWHPSKNGSTYVVTGVDKTSHCSTMAFQVPLDAPAKLIAMYKDSTLYSPDGRGVASNVEPDSTTSHSLNLCIFLRGIRIGVGRTEWIENTEVLPDDGEFATPYTELYFPPPWATAIKAQLRRWAGLEIVEPHVVIYSQHPFHISDIIGPMILSLRPDTSLVLMDDMVEFIDSNQNLSTNGTLKRHSPLTFSCVKGATFKDFRKMVKELFESYDVIERQGVLRLERNSKETIDKLPWRKSIRHLFWPIRKRNWAGRGFTELVRRGQYHMDTNQYLPVEYPPSDASSDSN